MNPRFPTPVPALSLAVFSQIPPRQTLTAARKCGYTAVGIPAAHPAFSPAYLGQSGLRDLRASLEKNGLAVSWLSAGPAARFTAPAGLQEDVDFVSRLVEAAFVFPASTVVACAGPVGSADSKASAALLEALSAVSAIAGPVSLALLCAPGESALVESILERLPGAPIGLLFDPGAALFAGRDPLDAASTTPRIAAVRASDSSPDEPNLPPGLGRVPWRDLLATLAGRDYDGYLNVEFAPRPSAAEHAANAFDVLRGAAL